MSEEKLNDTQQTGKIVLENIGTTKKRWTNCLTCGQFPISFPDNMQGPIQCEACARKGKSATKPKRIQHRKQIGFYADADIEEYLDKHPLGNKSKMINEALRLYKDQEQHQEARLIELEARVTKLEAQLHRMKP